MIALASIDTKQIEGMKQPFIESLFNILNMCRQRQIADEQTSKQSKMTSIWHPILGHIRGKTSVMTVFVVSSSRKQIDFISHLDPIKILFNVLFFNINIFGRKHLLISYSNRYHREMSHRRQVVQKKKQVNRGMFDR